MWQWLHPGREALLLLLIGVYSSALQETNWAQKLLPKKKKKTAASLLRLLFSRELKGKLVSEGKVKMWNGDG